MTRPRPATLVAPTHPHSPTLPPAPSAHTTNIACEQEFFDKECWKHHPLPYADFVQFKRKERKELDKACAFVIRD